MLKIQCENYLKWCKKYSYNPKEAKSLKAYIKLKEVIEND